MSPVFSPGFFRAIQKRIQSVLDEVRMSGPALLAIALIATLLIVLQQIVLFYFFSR